MNHKTYFFGAPIREKERGAYEDAVLRRFGGDIEKACAYVDKVTDSQIGRASNILSSTSLLAGMSYFVNAPYALIVALVSLLIVTSSLYAPWPGTPEEVVDERIDFHRTFQRIYYRAICNRIGITLIILTVLLILPRVVMRI